MTGFGIGEGILIGLIVGFIGIALLAGVFSPGGLRPGRGGEIGGPREDRILDELASLQARMDALERRLERGGEGTAEGESASSSPGADGAQGA